jgi:hypothetical protein
MPGGGIYGAMGFAPPSGAIAPHYSSAMSCLIAGLRQRAFLACISFNECDRRRVLSSAYHTTIWMSKPGEEWGAQKFGSLGGTSDRTLWG